MPVSKFNRKVVRVAVLCGVVVLIGVSGPVQAIYTCDGRPGFCPPANDNNSLFKKQWPGPIKILTAEEVKQRQKAMKEASEAAGNFMQWRKFCAGTECPGWLNDALGK